MSSIFPSARLRVCVYVFIIKPKLETHPWTPDIRANYPTARSRQSPRKGLCHRRMSFAAATTGKLFFMATTNLNVYTCLEALQDSLNLNCKIYYWLHTTAMRGEIRIQWQTETLFFQPALAEAICGGSTCSSILYRSLAHTEIVVNHVAITENTPGW
jgi:hypothetical protein